MAETDSRLSVFTHDPSQHTRLLSVEERSRLDLVLQAGLVRYRLDSIDRAGSTRLLSSPDELPEGLSRNASTGELIYPVIIYTDNPGALRASGIEVNTVMPGFATARVREHQIEQLAGAGFVESATTGELQYPQMDQSLYETRAHLLHGGYLNETRFAGKDAIVVVFDTGVDWQHPNFLDPEDSTRSRILYLWDVTLVPENGETTPGGGLDYGVEYNRSQIEAALQNPDLIRSRDTNGHGTHVLGSAAASGTYIGVAPDADIIVVRGGVNSFSLANIINGLEYARVKGNELGKPVVVNLSLGGRVGPRDGTRADEVAIDVLSQNPGYVVVTSAGNDGARSLHRTGTFGGGTTADLVVQVPVYTPRDGKYNDQFALDVWMDSTEPITATLRSPEGKVFEAPGNTDMIFDSLANGTVYMFNGQNNGRTNIFARVYDELVNFAPKSGDWTLTLSSPAEDIRFDGWLALFSVGNTIATLLNGSTDYSVTMPATAASAITVGAYTVNRNFVNASGTSLSFTASIDGAIANFSSMGPTRDGRQKPEIAAPGYVIRASLSGDETLSSDALVMPGNRHMVKSGTSMAAPHVAGAVAVLMGANPSLTAEEAKGFLMNSTYKDSFTGPVNGNIWGSGKMNLLNAMKQMLNVNTETATEFLRYHGPLTSPSAISPLLDATTRYAVRFRPGITGDVTGFQLYLWNIGSGDGHLFAEIYSNSSDEPGTILGQRVEIPVNDLTPALYNYIDLSESGVRVQANTEYHVVFGVEGSGTLNLAIDNGEVLHNRSLMDSSGSWQFMTDGSSIREIAAKVEITSGLLDGSVVPIPDETEIPRFVKLEQNYPNPFNPATTIVYTVPHQTYVTLSVYDLLGRRVALLVNEPRQQGTYTANWDASGVASGMYVYRIEAAGQSLTKKMTLLK